MRTLNQHVVEILSAAKRPLQNQEIRQALGARRPWTTAATVDVILHQASKKGLIEKKPAPHNAFPSKFLYSVPKQPSVASVVRSIVKGSKIDSLEVFMAARSVLPGVTKHAIDGALYQLVKKATINKSKNPMTDANSISSQSKFLYSAK
jgi:hypothetical protein